MLTVIFIVILIGLVAKIALDVLGYINVNLSMVINLLIILIVLAFLIYAVANS